MTHSRKRDWDTRDFIKQAKERGYLPDIGVDLETQPTLPDSEDKDPSYERGFYVGQFSSRSLAELKGSAYDEMMYQQWQDFQRAFNEQDYVQAIDGRPQASYAMQDAFVEVMKMTPFNFAQVILNVNDQADFEAFASTYLEFPVGADEEIGKDAFLRDGMIVPCWVMKLYGKLHPLVRLRNTDDPPAFDPATTPQEVDEDGNATATRPEGWWDRLVDCIIEEYPDNWPCLVTFTRKVIYGSTIVFVEGDNEPDDTTVLGQMTTAEDAATFDPRVASLLSTNSLRPEDGWMILTIPRSAIQPWIDNTIENIDPPTGAGSGDPADPFGCGDCPGGGSGGEPPTIDPGDPPTGTTPPPGDGSDGPPAPGGIIGDRATFDCDTEILFEQEGTGHQYALIDFSYSQNATWFFLGLQSLTPVWAMDVMADIFAGVGTAVEAWRVANSKPSDYEIRRVVLCFTFQRMKRVALLADGEETFITIDMDRQTGNPFSGFTDPKPRLRVQRGGSGSDKIVKGEIKRLGSWGYPVNGVEMQVIGDVEVAEDVKVTITEYQSVTGLVFYMVDVPAKWDFWNYSATLPVVKIGLESADLYYATSKFSGHFSYDHVTLQVNPNSPTEDVWYSDVPNGYVTGIGSDPQTGNYWVDLVNLEPGNCVLVNSASPTGGRLPFVNVLGVANGYSKHPDASYTSCLIHMKAIGGAQTLTLQINTVAGGGGTTFTAAMATAGNGATPEAPTFVDVTFDISSLGLTTASDIHYILLYGGFLLYEWQITLS